eukprot:m.305850 g.305850  ORF g.305850 m.305850 type:complete len:1526 (-) comp19613_c0_seq7:81-4658(-)
MSRPRSDSMDPQVAAAMRSRVGSGGDQSDAAAAAASKRRVASRRTSERLRRMSFDVAGGDSAASASGLATKRTSNSWNKLRATVHAASVLGRGLARRKMLRKTIVLEKTVVGTKILDATNEICVVFEDGELLFFDDVGLLQTRSTFVDTKSSVIKSAAFNADGTFLALGLACNELVVLDVASGDPVNNIAVMPLDPAKVKKKSCTVRFVRWSRDGTMIITGGEDRSARVYRADTGELAWKVDEPHTDFVVSGDLSPDGRYFVTGCKDKRVRVFLLGDLHSPGNVQSVESRTPVHTYKFDRTYAVTFSPDGSTVSVGSDDKKIHVIDMETGQQTHRLKGHQDYVRTLAYSADGTRLLSGGKDGTLQIFDTDSMECILLVSSLSWVIDLAVSQTTPQVVVMTSDAASNARILNVFNVNDHASMSDISAIDAGATVLSLDFSPCGQYVACGLKNKSVVIYDVSEYKQIGVLAVHKKAVNAVAFSPDGEAVVSASQDGTLVVFLPEDPAQHEVVLKGKAPLLCVAFSPCGKWMCCGDSEGTVSVFNVMDEKVAELHHPDGAVTALAFAPCSCGGSLAERCTAMLATGCNDAAVRAFNVDLAVQLPDTDDEDGSELEMGTLLWTANAHKKEVFSLAFSPDGSVVASASRDKTVKLLDAVKGVEMLKLADHYDHVKGVSFTPEGDVVTACLDKTVRIFDVRSTPSASSFGVRFRTLPSQVHSLATAPFGRFSQLAAVGLADGFVHFVDLSWCRQQPFFAEAVMVIERDRNYGRLDVTKAMVERYPLCVHAFDADGNTLAHYAVNKEDDRLLAVLLNANLPRFWLPVNNKGHDILYLAGVVIKARTCVKLILEKIIEAKENGSLAPLPFKRDRFLVTLLRMTHGFDDLVASFLSRFGLDEADSVVGQDLQMTTPSDTAVAGSHDRAPVGFWKNYFVAHARPLSSSEQARRTRMSTRFISIANVAGVPASPDGSTPDGIERLGNTVLHTFVHRKTAQLFGNAIMRTVLHFKWEKYAGKLFRRELSIFSVNLLLFTIFSLSIAKLDREASLWATMTHSRGLLATVLSVILPLFSAHWIMIEKVQLERSMIVRRRGALLGASALSWKEFQLGLWDYFTDWWNALQLSGATLTTLSSLLFLMRSPLVLPVAGIASFLMWLEVMYFLRALESTGGLVRMVFKVFYYTGPFLLLLSIVLFGSANCLHLLTSTTECDSSRSELCQDDGFPDAVFKVYQILLLGDAITANANSSFLIALLKIVSLSFLLGVNIFMLNLMINLMDDFMQKINDEEGDAFPFEKARVIAELELCHAEDLLTDPSNFPRWLHVYSAKDELEKDGLADEWKGTVNAIRSENAYLERRTRAAIAEFGDRVDKDVKSLELRMGTGFSDSTERLVHQFDALQDHVLRLHGDMSTVKHTVNFMLHKLAPDAGEPSSRRHSSRGSVPTSLVAVNKTPRTPSRRRQPGSPSKRELPRPPTKDRLLVPQASHKHVNGNDSVSDQPQTPAVVRNSPTLATSLPDPAAAATASTSARPQNSHD